MDLNKLAQEAYEIAKSKGWHDVDYSDEHYLMLVITELSEAVEEDRKGNRANIYEYKKSVKHTCKMELPGDAYWANQRKLWYNDAFVREIKDTLEDELADAVIRLLDLAALREIDVCCSTSIRAFPDTHKSFSESIFLLIQEMSLQEYSLRVIICSSISYLLSLAQISNIDIEWHIEQKMKYNKTRARLHGKKY